MPDPYKWGRGSKRNEAVGQWWSPQVASLPRERGALGTGAALMPGGGRGLIREKRLKKGEGGEGGG